MPRTAKAPAKVEPPKVHIITNDVKGRTLHIGDGRRLAYGESCEVSAEVAALFA